MQVIKLLGGTRGFLIHMFYMWMNEVGKLNGNMCDGLLRLEYQLKIASEMVTRHMWCNLFPWWWKPESSQFLWNPHYRTWSEVRIPTTHIYIYVYYDPVHVDISANVHGYMNCWASMSVSEFSGSFRTMNVLIFCALVVALSMFSAREYPHIDQDKMNLSMTSCHHSKLTCSTPHHASPTDILFCNKNSMCVQQSICMHITNMPENNG